MKQKVFGIFFLVMIASFLSTDRVSIAANLDGCSSVGQSCANGGICGINAENGDLYCPPSTQTTPTPTPIPTPTPTPTPTSTSTTTTSRTTTTPTATSTGLYIPRGSEIGLSDMRVTDLVRNLLNWLLYIFGFVAIIAFVIAGLQYLMAGADSKMAEKAKESMQYAMIGVLVALSALIVVRAIQSVLSGSWMF